MTTINARRYRSITYAFNRTTDTVAYSAGDLVANSTTSGSVAPLSWSTKTGGGSTPFVIPRIRLHKTKSDVTNAQFRIHLFSATPTFAAGDNSDVATTVATPSANWIGSFDGTMVAKFADGCAVDCVPTQALRRFDYASAGASLYGVIEALAAYTPASGETFTATLIAEYDQ